MERTFIKTLSRYQLWLLSIILLAWAVRLYNLTYHSIWFDEAISIHWARQTVPRILEVGFSLVEDRLPPLYYLLLKGWTALYGFSETSIRSLSVIFGVLLIPILASLASLLFNRRVALITALLAAGNPFLIWYSQEARMYAPAVLFGALSVWAFLQLCRLHLSRQERRQRREFITLFTTLFILAAIAGLYSHLYTGFLLPALGLWLVISYPRSRRLWLIFAAGGLIISLAFAPIALATWRFSAEAIPGDPLTGIARRAWELLQAFTLWKAPLPASLRTVIPIIVILFVFFAYLPLRRAPRPGGQISPLRYPRLLATLLLICPFIIASLLLFRNYLAFFGERYFIAMIPWLLLLAAAGADNLAEWLHSLMDKQHEDAANRTNSSAAPAPRSESRVIYYFLPVILIVFTFLPIPGQWSIPASKEAWRQSVQYLARYTADDHALLIHPDWVRYPFQYYFKGPGQTYAAFSNVSPETALDAPLQGVVGDHPVIWLIQSHLDAPDPGRLVERWLAARYPLVTELYPPGIAIKGYAPGYQLDSLPAEATPVDYQFENGLRLAGYRADAVASAVDELFHPPSGWVHVTLYWTADRPITADVKPFVHLVGPEGIWGINLDRPNDALKLFPPSRWPAQRTATGPPLIIRHDLDVNLNPAVPPGSYQLVVGMPGSAAKYPLAMVEIR